MIKLGRNRPERVVAERQRGRLVPAWAARLVAAWRGRRGAAPRPGDWRETMRARLFVCAGLFACWTGAIEARLFFLQVIDHADLMVRADRQQLRTLNPPAKRGEIVDRNGRVLAYSVDADTIAADPSEIDDPDGVARQVCAALDGCTADRRADMAKKLRRKRSLRLSRPSDVARGGARGSRRCSCRASRFSRKAAATTRTASWRRTSSATSASTTSALAASNPPTTGRSAAATERS